LQEAETIENEKGFVDGGRVESYFEKRRSTFIRI
jgi:hypothetical protein